MSYVPEYRPRPCSKIAAACEEIAARGWMSCLDLASELECEPRNVAAFMSTPLDRGYVARVHRQGILGFSMASAKAVDEPAAAVGVDVAAVHFQEPPKASGVLEQPSVPASAPAPTSVAAPEPAPATALTPVPTPERVIEPAAKAPAAPQVVEEPAFACGFSSDGEIRMTTGEERVDLSVAEARVLRRMLNAMHKAELL